MNRDDFASQAQASLAEHSLHIPERFHIAIMSEPFLSMVFDGRKTVESRFSINKTAPFKRVQTGDIVFMKHGQIVGAFTATWVHYVNLEETPIDIIQQEYGPQIGASHTFWQQKSHARYATLIGIGDVQTFNTPFSITKKDRRGWVSFGDL